MGRVGGRCHGTLDWYARPEIEGYVVTGQRLRVAVVDDIAVSRAGLRAELQDAGHEVQAFEDGATCIGRLEHDPVDVAICDLYLHGEAGPPAFPTIDALVALEQRVIVYSTWALDPDVLAVIDAGAIGYVQKAASADPLLSAVRYAATLAPDAGPILTPEVAAAVRRRERFGLTRAELEVLTYVGQHLTNLEIAQLRHVSEDTIKTQLTSIRGKLGATNRAGAVRTAHQHGLIGRWNRTAASA